MVETVRNPSISIPDREGMIDVKWLRSKLHILAIFGGILIFDGHSIMDHCVMGAWSTMIDSFQYKWMRQIALTVY